jgi:hypothetical protein
MRGKQLSEGVRVIWLYNYELHITVRNFTLQLSFSQFIAYLHNNINLFKDTLSAPSPGYTV